MPLAMYIKRERKVQSYLEVQRDECEHKSLEILNEIVEDTQSIRV